MNNLPTSYQTYIHQSRYARWNEKEKRRETWEETVKRYVDFFAEHLKEECNYDVPEEDYNLVYKSILNLEVMPSMRALWTAGPALKRDNIAGYNPVSGDTLILTKEFGVLSISECVGKKLKVLNKDGKWADGIFNSYGKQNVLEVNLKLNSNTKKMVKATANHRWILSDGTVKSTLELNVGDRIDFVAAPKPIIDDDYRLGVIHGLIYGDGTATYSQKRVKGYHIRVCSDIEDILPWFEGYPISYPNSAGGDPVVMVYDGFAKTHDLKSLPDGENETDSYLLGFFRGWFAADGYIGKNSQISICVDDFGKKWLRKYGPKLGYVFTSEFKHPRETNYGERKRDTYSLTISRSSMTLDDILIQRKKNNFKELKSYFVVSSVVNNNSIEDVYCAEVKDTNTFVLDMGLVTGNCSFITIDRSTSFDEILYILMNGTGVGFSVERQFVSQLPVISESFHNTDTTIVVDDSKLGWAKALKELIHLLYGGQIPRWDTNKLRPAGAKLKTFGGRSSGPEPLNDLFKFTVNVFKNAAGRKLTSLECHDLVCKIAEIVVVGGVRRSALISLSNLSDDRMRAAKSGNWWEHNVQRALSNNSAAYTEKPDIGIFMKEWLALYESKSGERGIFNRVAAQRKSKENGRRDHEHEFGTNPCGEIILRPFEFCNLSEVVVRDTDTWEVLQDKVRVAAIIGTWQSTLIKFKYINKKWQRNCEEERLLGVSLTGIMDHPVLNAKTNRDELKDNLIKLKQVAVDVNAEYAEKLGIPQSAAITTMKPSGTVSQLVDSASGIHARHSKYYIRTVRQDKKDPLGKFMFDYGVPVEDDLTKPEHTWIFSFPIKSPETSVVRTEMSAIEQLETWLLYRTYWCEHNPSVTISVKENEWLEVGAWVYERFNDVGGVSFLPASDHNYRQAPYQECTKEEYEELLEKMPNINWEKLREYEQEDNTEGAGNYACVSGNCEL